MKCQSLNQQSSCMFLFRDDSCPGSGMTRCMVSQWYGNGITMLSNCVTMASQCYRNGVGAKPTIFINGSSIISFHPSTEYEIRTSPGHLFQNIIARMVSCPWRFWRVEEYKLSPDNFTQVYNMQTQPFGIRITHSSFLFSTSAQIVNMMSMHWVEVLSFIYQQSF